MKKITALRLGFSAIFLAVLSYGAGLHAHATPDAGKVQAAHSSPVAANTSVEDTDLIGVVGDVFIDGCKSGDTRCSKAWEDLGELARKQAL